MLYKIYATYDSCISDINTLQYEIMNYSNTNIKIPNNPTRSHVINNSRSGMSLHQPILR